MPAGLTSAWECARLRTTMIEAAWLWLRYQPGSALSRWFQEPLKLSNHFDSARGQAECRAAGRFSRTIALRLSRYGSRRPSQICHPAEKRRTMSRRSIPPHRCAASNFQLILDRAFPPPAFGRLPPPLRRGWAASYPRYAGTGNGRFCYRSRPSSPFEFQLPHRDRSFTKERLRVGPIRLTMLPCTVQNQAHLPLGHAKNCGILY
jgi:hypothetical protein